MYTVGWQTPQPSSSQVHQTPQPSSSQPHPPHPQLRLRQHAPQYQVNVSSYRRQDEDLAFVGVDYGFHTLATSVPMTEETVRYHLKSLNNAMSCTKDESE
ncbi:hypothetical protein O0I10_000068 [Lichtheimia ornata]|uniref:Uncharacterized protein n=1 Tax=Lichtheimia ornata TaxID=688661 RepID=A0AAD8DIB0_9FUNG|nr:uncharacterized protein O0I10_000068 [Lichtheimia ornata]KAJ8663794.1 hypothetical protein O0I10_000068 [Lichtheimia ornata]